MGKFQRFLKPNHAVLFLIHFRGSLEKKIKILERILIKSPLSHDIIIFNRQLPNCPSLNVQSSEDFLSKEDYENIDNAVFQHLSKTWVHYQNATHYEEIPLGNMVEYDFQKYLTPRIKNIEVIRKILSQKKIHQIVIIDDVGELKDIKETLGTFFKIPVFTASFQREFFPWVKALEMAKSTLAYFLSEIFARKALKHLYSKKIDKALLVDSRLYPYFNKENKSDGIFISCLLEEGTRVRFSLQKKIKFYLSFHVSRRKKYKAHWERYEKLWEALSMSCDFKALFTYYDIPIWHLVQKKISEYFIYSFPRMISNIYFLEEFFQKKNIKCVILRNDHKEFEKTLIYAARRFQIPSLVLQHGILAETNGHHVLLADWFLAWGKASQEWYQKMGNLDQKVIVTGNLRFDHFPKWKPLMSKEIFYHKFKLNLEKKIILFVTQQINKFSSFWTEDLFHMKAEIILKTLSRFSSENFGHCQLVIKVDPYESISPYHDLIRKNTSLDVDSTALKDVDLYTLLFFSDMVITLDSTVALEAMFFDKPVIVFNLTQRPDRVPYAAKRAALGVYKKEDLSFAIEKILYDEESKRQMTMGQKEFIEQYAYRLDGNSIDRVFSFLNQYVF